MSHQKTQTKDICRGKLTVKKYLNHMIDHHQVALDISIYMQKHTKWDRLQGLEKTHMGSVIGNKTYENISSRTSR